MRVKRKVKKGVSLLLVFLMMGTMLQTAVIAASDTYGHWAENVLVKWSDMGQLMGDGNGNIRPDDSITRAEFITLINRMKNYSGRSESVARYIDVGLDAWYYDEISAALAEGYISGTGNNTMSPDRIITRQEAMVIIARVSGLSLSDSGEISALDEALVASWARSAVGACINNGLVAGFDGKINPDNSITRAEAVVLMERAYSDTRTFSFPGTYGPSTGKLNVASVTIATPGVRLQNMSVAGDLIVAETVGNGDVWFNNIEIKGSLLLYGGGASSVYCTGCDITELSVEKAGLKILLENTTVSTVNINADDGKIETTSDVKIDVANFYAGANLTGDGIITVANINAPGVSIETTPGSVNVASDLTANIAGEETVGDSSDSNIGSSNTRSSSRSGSGYVPSPVETNEATLQSVSVPGASDYDVNYILVTLAESYEEGYIFKLNDELVTATPVRSDGKVVKIAVGEDVTSGTIEVTRNDNTVISKSLTFSPGGKNVPEVIYGTISMLFSEFFYDVYGNDVKEISDTGTSFMVGGTVEQPEKFITQGTRSGSNGTVTYAEGDLLEKVDAVSSATYGDNVHYVTNGNHSVEAPEGRTSKHQDNAITGILKAEVGVDFDLYANAALLNAANLATEQSANVLSKLAGDSFELASIKTGDSDYVDTQGNMTGAGVYKPKHMLIDGNWGARAGVLDDTVVKALPGDGTGGTEGVTYFGNWGEYMTGFVFDGSLGDEYGGGNYFHNFAEYIYGGYIEDENGNVEPLVFLQNIFTHLNHTDFDVAISPSRFARFDNLELPGTLQVTVLVYGFPDIEFDFEIKDYVNSNAAISGTSNLEVEDPTQDFTFKIDGIDNPAAYASDVKLYKGNTEVTGSDKFSVTETVDDSVTVTIRTTYLNGLYQGAHTLRYETESAIAKSISFTLINPVAVLVKVNDDGEEKITSKEEPIVANKEDALYFSNSDFASTLVVSGRSGYSTVKEADADGNGVTFGAALQRSGDVGSSYYVDLNADVFEEGKTYLLTMTAPGFKNQMFYVTITDSGNVPDPVETDDATPQSVSVPEVSDYEAENPVSDYEDTINSSENPEVDEPNQK